MLRLWLWKIFRCFPRFIQELPYFVCYFFLWVVVRLQSKKTAIGYRNSLALRRIEPFLSDLDVTIICDGCDRQKVIHLYNRLKRWLPALGELNLYNRETFHVALAKMNACERARDPKLRLQVHQLTDPTQEEKIVFISRMLEADWFGLDRRPKSRQQKWRGHFRDIGWPVPETINRESVLNLLLERADFKEANEIVTSVLEQLKSDIPAHLIPGIGHPAVQTLFLHRACFTEPRHELRTKDWEIIDAQKKWECWALYVVPVTPVQSSALHLKNLENFARANGSKRVRGHL